MKNGVVNGIENADGTRSFAPDTALDRETMVTIIANYLNVAEGQDTTKLDAMPDADEVDSWAANSMAWALNNGVINGVDVDGERQLQPTAVVVRQVAAAVVSNASLAGLL